MRSHLLAHLAGLAALALTTRIAQVALPPMSSPLMPSVARCPHQLQAVGQHAVHVADARDAGEHGAVGLAQDGVRHVVAEQAGAQPVATPELLGCQLEAERDTSGRRLGSLVVMLVPVLVPLNSSSTLGKRTPRPGWRAAAGRQRPSRPATAWGWPHAGCAWQRPAAPRGGRQNTASRQRPSKDSRRRPEVSIQSGAKRQASCPYNAVMVVLP
jgi:hypothetical protein